jgi:hypothetical protein
MTKDETSGSSVLQSAIFQEVLKKICKHLLFSQSAVYVNAS